MPKEHVEDYLELYSELTIFTPAKYFAKLHEELLKRRAEFEYSEEMGDDRQVTEWEL